MTQLLDTPRLICRWRLHNAALPLENRHMRALSKRSVDGLVTKQLMAWTKQHIEWNLHEGAYDMPEGVLMLIVDAQGKAALSTGSYTPLAATNKAALCERAKAASLEAQATGIAPEALVVLDENNTLVFGAREDQISGMGSLVADLAKTHGLSVVFDEALLDKMLVEDTCEAALVSDEHGVVVSDESMSPFLSQLQTEVARLF